MTKLDLAKNDSFTFSETKEQEKPMVTPKFERDPISNTDKYKSFIMKNIVYIVCGLFSLVAWILYFVSSLLTVEFMFAYVTTFVGCLAMGFENRLKHQVNSHQKYI